MIALAVCTVRQQCQNVFILGVPLNVDIVMVRTNNSVCVCVCVCVQEGGTSI
jgi:hypothetical protein